MTVHVITLPAPAGVLRKANVTGVACGRKRIVSANGARWLLP